MVVLYKVQSKLVLIEPLYRSVFEISEETYGAKYIDFADSLN